MKARLSLAAAHQLFQKLKSQTEENQKNFLQKHHNLNNKIHTTNH
ncbi:MAG: hypothetical protein ACJA0S_000924 [Rickettsiales bacterium]|jgi:hypothetical protein